MGLQQVRALQRPAGLIGCGLPSTSPGLAARDEEIDDGGETEPVSPSPLSLLRSPICLWHSLAWLQMHMGK